MEKMKTLKERTNCFKFYKQQDQGNTNSKNEADQVPFWQSKSENSTAIQQKSLYIH